MSDTLTVVPHPRSRFLIEPCRNGFIVYRNPPGREVPGHVCLNPNPAPEPYVFESMDSLYNFLDEEYPDD